MADHSFTEAPKPWVSKGGKKNQIEGGKKGGKKSGAKRSRDSILSEIRRKIFVQGAEENARNTETEAD